MQNNPMQMIQAFNQFKQSFQGDPKTEVENLLKSGRMTQQQFNQIQQQATAFQQMLNSFKF